MDAHDRPPVNRFENGEWIGATLDHALWFHAPVRVDAWHLHDVRCVSYAGGRGLSIGTIFAADGAPVATVSQEGHLVPRLVGAPSCEAAEFYPGAHLAARGDHPAVIVHDHAADNDQPERAHLFTSLLDAIDADD